MSQQIDINFPPPPPVTIPGQYGQGEYVFGDICPHRPRVATDVWRYLKDSTGKQTTLIRRVCGRAVKDIAADLYASIDGVEGLEFEWATLGQPFKYKLGGLGPETECPEHHGQAVYVMHGGSEGHLVHVDLRIQPERGEPGGDGTAMRHMTLFMVKTLSGSDVAQAIARKLEEVLGVL
jgi:hypothetical protein